MWPRGCCACCTPRAPTAVYNIADDAPVTTVELHQLNGLEVPEDLHDRPDDDPWHGIVSTRRIRRELGFRPLYPSVWTAADVGAL